VEGALRTVGQAFTSVGALDPRLTQRGSTEFRLSRQLRGYSKADPAPNRVKPVPVDVIYHAASIAQQHHSAGVPFNRVGICVSLLMYTKTSRVC
jgi:hypothetical protein